MSLRLRIVLVVLVLLAIGLVGSDLATATSLRPYLLGRVDERVWVAAGFSGHGFMMAPAVGSIRRLTIFSAVVLPPPEGPTRTQNVPAGIVNESSCSAAPSRPA